FDIGPAGEPRNARELFFRKAHLLRFLHVVFMLQAEQSSVREQATEEPARHRGLLQYDDETEAAPATERDRFAPRWPDVRWQDVVRDAHLVDEDDHLVPHVAVL